MNFVDSEFLALLIVVFGLWLVLKRYERPTQFMLLAASFVFYGFHQWQLVFLLGAYCVVDWIAGLAIAAGYRRSGLVAGVGFNLVALAFWKYTPLLVNTAAWLAFGHEGADAPVDGLAWYLPIGISFYTFTGIAYVVDVYRGQAQAERDVFRFSLFMTFFPQLVAGPILRANEFLSDLKPGAMPKRTGDIGEALFLMGRGAFKKLVIADTIGRAIDPFFAHVGDASTQGVWSLPFLYLYALQIFFDFSGYTDIARGAGLLFGFRWPENFNRPYLAASAREFWRRWHMTLSRFLRDYLYVPLGGSRNGTARTLAALMITMLLGGLWHGAAWSFMIWGGLHGLFLVGHRVWRATPAAAFMDRLSGLGRGVWHAFCVVATFHLVTIAWSFFRLTELADSLACLEKLVSFDSTRLFVGGSADIALWGLVSVYLLAAWALPRARRTISARYAAHGETVRLALDGAVWGTASALALMAYFLSEPGRGDPFIYFRF